MNRLCVFGAFFLEWGEGVKKLGSGVVDKVITPYRKRIRPYSKIAFYMNLKSLQKTRQIGKSYQITLSLCIYLLMHRSRE